jgi:hypothetical protein
MTDQSHTCLCACNRHNPVHQGALGTALVVLQDDPCHHPVVVVVAAAAAVSSCATLLLKDLAIQNTLLNRKQN